MNLKSEEIVELNTLLADPKLIIPEFRNKVSSSGHNYSWLQKNITKKNKSIPDRLRVLLNI